MPLFYLNKRTESFVPTRDEEIALQPLQVILIPMRPASTFALWTKTRRTCTSGRDGLGMLGSRTWT